ncbi:MAG: hypothetical protein N3B21_05140 [Clostridia bacterium]|nr:hypothetical protein [Clostridia bacterium]
MRKPVKDRFMFVIKSEKGGLSGIVFEIVLSVVALSLLIVVIYLFRSNMDIIGSSAEKANELQKVKSESLIPLDKSQVKGGDVIAVIRYYADDATVNIVVNLGGGSTLVYSGNANPVVSSIPREALFTTQRVTDQNTGQTTITYTRI